MIMFGWEQKPNNNYRRKTQLTQAEAALAELQPPLDVKRSTVTVDRFDGGFLPHVAVDDDETWSVLSPLPGSSF